MGSEWILGRMAWGCGLDSTGSGQGPVAGCCECGDEPSGSCAMELVLHIYEYMCIYILRYILCNYNNIAPHLDKYKKDVLSK
jgi:hypothetical protein